MTEDIKTQFFECVCGCNAVAVTKLFDDTDVSIELWEPRRGGLTLSYRIKQAWRTLRGLGSMEETILTRPNARVLGEYLLSITADKEEPLV